MRFLIKQCALYAIIVTVSYVEKSRSHHQTNNSAVRGNTTQITCLLRDYNVRNRVLHLFIPFSAGIRFERVRQGGPWAVHTIMQYHVQDQKYPWTPSELQAKLLLNCFGAAVAVARQRARVGCADIMEFGGPSGSVLFHATPPPPQSPLRET